MSKTIFFDLDGCLADLYNVPDWLAKLRAFDPSPYIEARTMINMSLLARYLNKVQAGGWRIAVVSWLSKEPRGLRQSCYPRQGKLASAPPFKCSVG